MLANKLEGAAKSAVPVFVEDVFSTYLYDGNGSTQTITNGIDLAGKGGLVWEKVRDSTGGNVITDTARGSGKYLLTNTTAAQVTSTEFGAQSFSSTGFGSSAYTSGSIASWTFRKQAKFFDVVTWTGNTDGSSNQTISHSLGSVPGCIIIKKTSGTSLWTVWHRSLASDKYLQLQSTGGQFNIGATWTAPTSTEFTAYQGLNLNDNGGTYVAYLFAHDAGGFGASGTDNVISCGSFSGSGTAVTLGWEPQWLLMKQTSTTGDWMLLDNMRGMQIGTTNDPTLFPNSSAAEGNYNIADITSTGFINGGNSGTFIYIAIRRGPMKTPTDATKVFTPTVYTGTNVDNRLIDTTIAPDMVMIRCRNDGTVPGMVVGDRLRGQPYLLTGSVAAEVSDADSFDQQIISTTEYGTAFSSMSGIWVGNDGTSQLNLSTTASNQVVEAFKRAPGFFDVVCYTGTGSARTVSHNLGVAPELMIVKSRSSSSYRWAVYNQTTGNTKALFLDLDSAESASNAIYWNNTSPTATEFTTGTSAGINANGETYVAYLFASCPGVSKVGSFTGNGTSQTINCGFTSGARLVILKRTDAASAWLIFDSARGIVSGNDKYLFLNANSSENNSPDLIDPDNSGFIAKTASDFNVNGATYIYLAIA